MPARTVDRVASARQYVRAVHRRLTLNRAFAELARDPAGCLNAESAVLPNLTYGWGNEGWSGSQDFLRGCIREALAATGPILECGSGLSTLITGIVARARGIPLVALEHMDEWHARVQDYAARLGLVQTVSVYRAPLKRYGDYEWYETPTEIGDVVFALVVCDGPPGATRGGRYGLLPRLCSMIGENCVILLDDAARPEEQAVAQRWLSEAPFACETVGGTKPYFRFVRQPGSHPS